MKTTESIKSQVAAAVKAGMLPRYSISDTEMAQLEKHAPTVAAAWKDDATNLDAALSMDQTTLINASIRHGSAFSAEASDVLETLNIMKVASEEIQRKQNQADRAANASLRPSYNAADRWVDDEGSVIRVMRKGTDFRAAYAAGDSDDITLSDFVRGIAKVKSSSAMRNALSVGTDTAGGYAVPTVLMPGILEALVPASSLLQAGAGMVDIAGAGKTFNTAAISTIPTAAWRAESGAVSASDPTFRLVSASPRSLAFYFKVSRELLHDALNLEDALRTAISQSFAKALDLVGLRGSGTAPEPRGILNTSGIQSVTNGTNGASLATTAYTNFISAVQSLLAADAPASTAAIMAPRSLTTLAGLLDTTNQPRQAPAVIAKIPFLTTSQIPVNLTVGTSTDCSEIYLGDFSKLVFIMRERPSIQLAGDLFAGTGEIGFICHVRADVAIQYPAAFAVVTGVRA